MFDLKGYHKNTNCADKIGSVYYDKDDSNGDDWIRITPIPGSDHCVVTWVEHGEDVKISLIERSELEESQKTVTEELIMQRIRKCDYIFPPSGKSCVCEITLENGFTVRGESAVVDVAYFDADVAKKIAYESAFNKIWPLEGYLLQDEMYREGKTK